jgi:hypothetical protein
MMTFKTKAALSCAAFAALVGLTAQRAFHATPPTDMPASARFVSNGYDQATAEPTGNWVACRPRAQQDAAPADWCRVTDQRGSVIFEGKFLPTDSPAPVPSTALTIGELSQHPLWTKGPTEAVPVPIIPLKDGQILVPEADRSLLLNRWAEDPTEAHKYQ